MESELPPGPALNSGSEPKGIHNPVLKDVFGKGEGADIIAQMIANILKVAFSIAGLVLLIMLIYSAFELMTAGGDKERAMKAKNRLSNALIGFVILVSVFAIINFILPLFGLENILNIEWPTIE